MGHAGMERRRSPLIPALTPASCSLLGWAAAVTFNPQAGAELRRFRQRPDTFSLGVCNGCQLLALLGWVGGSPGEEAAEMGHEPWPARPGLLLRHNRSGRFESRWASVRVGPGPALMLRGMEGAVLPVWSAHGEGQAPGRRGGPEGKGGGGRHGALLSRPSSLLLPQVTWHFLPRNSKPRLRPGVWLRCTGRTMTATPRNSTP